MLTLVRACNTSKHCETMTPTVHTSKCTAQLGIGLIKLAFIQFLWLYLSKLSNTALAVLTDSALTPGEQPQYCWQ